VSVVAELDLMSCLAWTGSFCTVCSERCPEPDAIWLDLAQPIIDEDRCTGCGVCVQVCPARFGPAIRLLPRNDEGAA